jgi:hypothetical protein
MSKYFFNVMWTICKIKYCEMLQRKIAVFPSVWPEEEVQLGSVQIRVL